MKMSYNNKWVNFTNIQFNDRTSTKMNVNDFIFLKVKKGKHTLNYIGVNANVKITEKQRYEY